MYGSVFSCTASTARIVPVTEAKSRNISLDDLVNEILKEELKKYEKKIWKEDLIEKINDVIDDISKNKVKYFIYDYEDLQKPVAVLLSVEEYKFLIEETNILSN